MPMAAVVERLTNPAVLHATHQFQSALPAGPMIWPTSSSAPAPTCLPQADDSTVARVDAAPSVRRMVGDVLTHALTDRIALAHEEACQTVEDQCTTKLADVLGAP